MSSIAAAVATAVAGPKRPAITKPTGSSQTMNCGESTLPHTSSAIIVAAAAATNRRASPGWRERCSPSQKLHAIAITSTIRIAVMIAAITAGPVPSRPWLPYELSIVTGTSARACSPSR